MTLCTCSLSRNQKSKGSHITSDTSSRVSQQQTWLRCVRVYFWIVHILLLGKSKLSECESEATSWKIISPNGNRQRNVKAIWKHFCFLPLRCEIWPFWSISSMLDVLYSVYIYYMTKNLCEWGYRSTAKTLHTSLLYDFLIDLPRMCEHGNQILEVKCHFCISSTTTSPIVGQTGSPARSFEPKMDKIPTENKYTLYLLEQLVLKTLTVFPRLRSPTRPWALFEFWKTEKRWNISIGHRLDVSD